MSLEGNEWELSKENVQPLRQGRVMATLEEALAQQDVSIHTTIQQQKREFESEIRFYCGDDPLDVWDRYIKWTEQTFPQGGKDSNLSAVLERAVKAMNEQQRYYEDPRYLNLWLKFGNCCSEPLDLYSYLSSQGIGTSLAQLYITWAEELEARGNYKKADLIFQEGICCKAEPLDKLLCHHRQFQARVSRQTLEGLEEDCDTEELVGALSAEPQRTTLAELKGRGKKIAKAPISRVGNTVKLPGQGQRLQTPSSQQASNRPTFAVFDENRVVTSGPELPALVPQPWVAPPPVKAKENELQPGAWNMGRRPRSNMDSAITTAVMVPSFTPYVDEYPQQQAMTPCKIEPSMNCVLSVRKPKKEDDPLHRVQNHQQDGQEKKEQPMYCKEKVYAGVEEFSLEEIRAEIYKKKAKKKREEELQALAQKKTELQREIEKIEKVVREQREKHKEKSDAQHADKQESEAVSSNLAENLKPPIREELCAPIDSNVFVEESHSDCFFLKSNLEQHGNVQHKKSSSSSDSDIPPAVTAPIPFSIFDESILENEGASCSAGPLVHARCPLTVRKPSESSIAKENIPPENSHEPPEMEHLVEDAILTGSYKNKTLCPNPEDTCDFVRAAHLASTPFHGIIEQRNQLGNKAKGECQESKTTLLMQKMVENDDPYAEALFVKKLSPIMEASQEDTRSSASSTSSSSQISIKFQKIPETLELAHISSDDIASDADNGSNYSPVCSEQRKLLLQPLLERLTKCPDFILEAQPMPWIELEKEAHLELHPWSPELRTLMEEMVHARSNLPWVELPGQILRGAEKKEIIWNDIYYITREYLNSGDDKMFSAVQSNFAHQVSAAFLVKVHFEPVPWDFYILLQLRERLGAGFDQNFNDNCTCFLYHNGCVTLQRERNCTTVQDMIQRCKVIPHEVVMLIADNLLEMVEKLHTVEVIHGNLHPESLFLGDRICNPFVMEKATSALKLVDFSHSLDLKLQPGVSSIKHFPIAQTQYGKQMLDEKSLPYQIDLLGIANTAHMILFGESLQVHQEEGYWKTNRDLSQFVDSDLWSKFFGKILNGNNEFTVPLLKELREELSGEFDSSFSERLCDSLTNLEGILHVENTF